jgi:SAM-dependent methyltransferase
VPRKSLHRLWLEEKLEELYAKNRPRGKVLDAGSKDARYRHFFKGCSYTAIDIEPKSDLVQKGDLTNLPFPDETFDHVLCTEVLEHMSNPFLASREILRVLKKGGTAIISAPYLALPSHEEYWRFSREGLGLLFAGAEVVYYTLGGYIALMANFIDSLSRISKSGLGFLLTPIVCFLGKLAKLERGRAPTMGYIIVLKKN